MRMFKHRQEDSLCYKHLLGILCGVSDILIHSDLTITMTKTIWAGNQMVDVDAEYQRHGIISFSVVLHAPHNISM